MQLLIATSCGGGGSSAGENTSSPKKNENNDTRTISGSVSQILSFFVTDVYAGEVCKSTCNLSDNECVILSEVQDNGSILELCRTPLTDNKFKFDVSKKETENMILKAEVLNFNGQRRQINLLPNGKGSNLNVSITPAATVEASIVDDLIKESKINEAKSILDSPGQNLKKDLIYMCEEITEDNVQDWVQKRLQILMSVSGKNLMKEFRDIYYSDNPDLSPIQNEINSFCSLAEIEDEPTRPRSWSLFAEAVAAESGLRS